MTDEKTTSKNVADRPTFANDCEITPAMIAAGVAEYFNWDSRVEDPEDLAVGIFTAMLGARTA